MYYCDIHGREPKEIFPGVHLKSFWGEKMLVSLTTIDAGTIMDAHSHPHEQLGYIIEGELTFIIDGQTKVLKAGEAYIIPGGVEHSVAANNGAVKVFDVFSPVREQLQW